MLQRLITACLFQHQAKNYLSYRLKIFAVGKKNHLGKVKEEPIKSSVFRLNRFSHFIQREMNISEWKIRKSPVFPGIVTLSCSHVKGHRVPC